MAVRVNTGVVAVNSPITNVGTSNNASIGFSYDDFVTGIAGRSLTLGNVLAGTVTAADFVAVSGAEFPTLNYSAFATANVTMATANTFYPAATLALNAGIYLVTGAVTVASPANTAQRVTAKLSDGTTVISAGEAAAPAQGTSLIGYVSIPLSGILSLSVAGTARIDVASTTANSVIQATPGDNGAAAPAATNRATGFSVVRIG